MLCTCMLLVCYLGSHWCLLTQVWPQVLTSIIKRCLTRHPAMQHTSHPSQTSGKLHYRSGSEAKGWELQRLAQTLNRASQSPKISWSQFWKTNGSWGWWGTASEVVVAVTQIRSNVLKTTNYFSFLSIRRDLRYPEHSKAAFFHRHLVGYIIVVRSQSAKITYQQHNKIHTHSEISQCKSESQCPSSQSKAWCCGQLHTL